MPMVTEIVGVSGAGKSTLSAALNDGNRQIRAGITVWGLPFSMLVGSSLLSLPALFILCAERRRIYLEEIKQVIRLNAFYRLLKREIGNRNSVPAALFLDEGIVFVLAKLRVENFGGQKNSGGFMSRWEKHALDRWSALLNGVVWLDAPDELLVERIRTRAKKHRMKHQPDAVIYDFLARYRASYEQIIKELNSRNPLKVIRFRTDDASLDRMAGEIIQFIDRQSAAGSKSNQGW